MNAADLLARLGQSWRERVRGRLRAIRWAGALLIVLVAAQVARVGTDATRLVAALLITMAVAAFIFLIVRERKRTFDARATIMRALKPAEPELASRALRAFALIESTENDRATGSPALAQLHFERLLGRANLTAVESVAVQRGSHYAMLAVALGLGCLLILMPGPMRVVEGIDVLLARKGRAPLEMMWLELARVSVKPPRYLQQEERQIGMQGVSIVPEGTELTIRGVARYPEHQLVLTDGKQEVPFVIDAESNKLVRVTVKQDAEFRVAARFGEVLIFEPRKIEVRAIADRAPEVQLEGAPQRLKLGETERIELGWEARDDHGLRQVDLVLRSGAREERRQLGRFEGGMAHAGKHVLFPNDSFLGRAFLPITVKIEARDTNPAETAKWGASEALTLIPPAVGESEALRFLALEQTRKAFLEFLVWLRSGSRELGQALFRKELGERVELVRQTVYDATGRRYGSISIPPGLRAFALSQLETLERGVSGSETNVELAERVTLAIDSATRALGLRDAGKVSQRLADVAEEVATSARVARETERRAQGLERLDQGLVALDNGAEELAKLSDLGADLGSVAQAGLGRIRRVRANEDLLHTELAALHLAERLRRATPSFSARSNERNPASSQGTGVESGAGGSGMPDDHASDADQKFDRLSQQLEQLVQEHAGTVSQMGDSLKQAKEQAQRDWDREEAKSRAEALRRAVANLPEPGEAQPGTSSAAAALAREHSNAMAHSVEKLNVEEAVENGKNALSAFEEAERGAADNMALRAELDRGRKEVERQLEWAKSKVAELEKQAEEKAREELGKQADKEEEHARRAQNLGESDDSEVSLPQKAREDLRRARELMDQASSELRAGKGEHAVELAREAQRLLERANSGESEQARKSEEENDSEQHQQRALEMGGTVPAQDARVRAEEFRRRVLKGLGSGSGGAVGPAVKRYAEGLLQ